MVVNIVFLYLFVCPVFASNLACAAGVEGGAGEVGKKKRRAEEKERAPSPSLSSSSISPTP